jgi:hypothetical protein
MDRMHWGEGDIGRLYGPQYYLGMDLQCLPNHTLPGDYRSQKTIFVTVV